jgi:hypothetical protein
MNELSMEQFWIPNGKKNQSIRESEVKVLLYMGYELAKLVEAVRYRLEGRGFDSLWCY